MGRTSWGRDSSEAVVFNRSLHRHRLMRPRSNLIRYNDDISMLHNLQEKRLKGFHSERITSKYTEHEKV